MPSARMLPLTCSALSALVVLAGLARAQPCADNNIAVAFLGAAADRVLPPTHQFGEDEEGKTGRHKYGEDLVAAESHGVAGVFTDLNGDGYADQYIPRAHRYGEVTSDAANILRLYNPITDEFEPFSDPAANHEGNGVGALATDFDNDGDIDLYVLNYNEPNRLLQNQVVPNDGGPAAFRFVDVTDTGPTNTSRAGVAYHEGVCLDNSLTAACADVDRDGDVDIYVSGWNTTAQVRHESRVDPPGAGHRGTLWLNQWRELGNQWPAGEDWFIDATMTSGGDSEVNAQGVTAGTDVVGAHNVLDTRYYRFHMATIFADMNNDGWPDLLVTDSFNPLFYRNLGVDAEGRPEFDLDTYDTMMNLVGDNRINAPMGVDAGDVDNDGDLDLYISSTKSEDLLINKSASGGALAFDLCQALDVRKVDDDEGMNGGPLTAWGIQFLDIDNDGWRDIHVGVENYPDAVWINGGRDQSDGDIHLVGPYRVEVPPDPEGNPDPHSSQRTIGTMQADYDRDGKVDLYTREVAASLNMSNNHLSFAWRNSADTTNRSLTFLLEGAPDVDSGTGFFSSRDALGARVQVDVDANGNGLIEPNLGEERIDEIHSGSSNGASTSMLAATVGVGSSVDVLVTIFWPSGKLTRFRLYPAGKVTIDGNDGGAGYVSVAEDAPDADGDAVPDEFDNCVNDPNPSQGDSDLDGFGDACDGVGGGGNDCKNSLDLDCDPPPLGATADFDGDGWVDDVDLWVVLSAIEVQGRRGDLNHDGFVDSKDVEIIYAQWGKVPEEESK